MASHYYYSRRIFCIDKTNHVLKELIEIEIKEEKRKGTICTDIKAFIVKSKILILNKVPMNEF